jgi:ABC-type transport system involved in Fe-S cluster assembly fused permease/ATPase subunit
MYLHIILRYPMFRQIGNVYGVAYNAYVYDHTFILIDNCYELWYNVFMVRIVDWKY